MKEELGLGFETEDKTEKNWQISRCILFTGCSHLLPFVLDLLIIFVFLFFFIEKGN